MGNYKTVHFKILPDNCSAKDQQEDQIPCRKKRNYTTSGPTYTTSGSNYRTSGSNYRTSGSNYRTFAR